ncbi:hypothetical protein ACH5RR_007029 [Cinchona calisaya]|uniref:Uncharacterized protein n=1 Tax=Cinchona calisaya TaxID=153742 RepID=A0ABD3AQZ6_9GENT
MSELVKAAAARYSSRREIRQSYFILRLFDTKDDEDENITLVQPKVFIPCPPRPDDLDHVYCAAFDKVIERDIMRYQRESVHSLCQKLEIIAWILNLQRNFYMSQWPANPDAPVYHFIPHSSDKEENTIDDEVGPSRMT